MNLFKNILPLFYLLILWASNGNAAALDLTGTHNAIDVLAPKNAAPPVPVTKADVAALPLAPDVAKTKMPVAIVENSRVIVSNDAGVTLESGGIPEALQELGLPVEAWHTTDRAKIVDIFEKLPTDYASPIFRSLGRAFLASTLRVPKSDNPMSIQNLLMIRADKLFAMGHSKEAFELLHSHRALHLKPLYLKLKFEQELMRKELDSACKVAQDQLKNAPSPYWEKAVTLCQIVQNNHSAAQLSLSVIGESRYPESEDFITAAQMILEPDFAANLPELKDPDLLSLILLNSSQEGLTDAVIKKLPARTRARLATTLNPIKVSADTRLALLEEAVQSGVAEGDTLKQAYHRYMEAHPHLVAEWRGKEKDGLHEQDAPSVRAYLFTKGLYTPDTDERFSHLAALLKNGEKSKCHLALSRALGTDLQSIQPEKGAADLADQLLATFILSGNTNATCSWRHYVGNANAPSTIPLLLLGCKSIDVNVRNNLLINWHDHLNKTHPENPADVMRYVEAIFAILETMGINIPYTMWEKISNRPPSKTVRHSLARKALIDKAIQDNRHAEALGYILIDFGGNLELWNLDNLLYVLKSFQGLHLDKVALQIATNMILSLQVMDASADVPKN